MFASHHFWKDRAFLAFGATSSSGRASTQSQSILWVKKVDAFWHFHSLKTWITPLKVYLVHQPFCVDWSQYDCVLDDVTVPNPQLGLNSLETAVCQGISSFFKVFQILRARYQARTCLAFFDTWPTAPPRKSTNLGCSFLSVFCFLGNGKPPQHGAFLGKPKPVLARSSLCLFLGMPNIWVVFWRLGFGSRRTRRFTSRRANSLLGLRRRCRLRRLLSSQLLEACSCSLGLSVMAVSQCITPSRKWDKSNLATAKTSW